MKLYKLTIAPISFIITPLTKRKKCPFCNGKGWHLYDTGKDGCELCGGFPGVSFKETLTSAIEDSKLKHITKVMDERGLTWKTEDYIT